ncbi:MAG: TIGR01777 family protein [Nitrospinae bacterium]|nr:TIGR01777 family protein [Nitrospinota bacterium]
MITRWTKSHKKVMYDSRINTTSRLVRAFEMMPSKPPLFISTSAVGFYAEGVKQTEDNFKRADDFLGTLAYDWEQAALKAVPLGVRTVVFRFGIVLGKGGGMLGKILLPFKLGLGGVIGDGSQSFSWVQIKDLERAYMAAIADDSFNGVYNLTSPNPTTNRGLTKALGKALNRPTVLPLPKFALRLLFGEGATAVIGGQEVYPKRLVEAGFKFVYPDIDAAVKASV